MSNVKLAIRVRPFTDREIKNEKEKVPVVSVVDEKTVAITNVKVSASGAGDSRERVRRYFADYTFDSCCHADDPAYASQEKVFESIGLEVASCVLRGQSACVLAYGQSATGKTHTMMGSEAEPGLVPRLCRALATEEGLDITVSFLEIYNERVHDLLAGDAPPACHSLPRRRGNASKDLRVREHPSRGPYVQNLRRVAVHDVETLLSLVSEGAQRRRTAATRRNSSSSRSHALLELTTKTATLHLADLAGSEKAGWEGFGSNSGRQKEGANINKSLVALSNVISALVNRGRFVPYRDSALTWLLKDCFTGGASTFIIATVSPSVSCYGESASTLRWAAGARQLPSPRLASTSHTTASRAALHAQLNRLIGELARHYIRYIPETGKISYGDEHWLLGINNLKNLQLDDLQGAKEEKTITDVKASEEKAVENEPQSLENNTTEITKEKSLGEKMDPSKSKTENLKPEGQTSESTASSVASGSSDMINVIDKTIKEEIDKEVGKVFGPALERTKSGTDISTAPLSHKKRHYKSQEILPIDKSLQIHEPATNEVKPHVPILYDNQRAEIVASVTERLYSKLKKKEENAVHKMESIVDRKIMEPLSELRICTNARQRLIDLSQRALRNKRRIGIPAHTQTRVRVTRVKDQGVDVQTDLEMYVTKKDSAITCHRDVATETIPLTPRCKEIAVGPIGSLNFRDSSTATVTKKVIHKNTLTNTDIIEKSDRCSQTVIVPPPRRKRRASNYAKYIRNLENKVQTSTDEISVSPVISINISQHYDDDSETQSSDEDRSEKNDKHTSATMTPDLLTNHNTVEACTLEHVNHNTVEACTLQHVNHSTVEACTLQQVNPVIDCQDEEKIVAKSSEPKHLHDEPTKAETEFQEPEVPEDYSLPRVTIISTKTATEEDLKDIIFGRNNLYPYNITVSPYKEKTPSKRSVKFEDPDKFDFSDLAFESQQDSNRKSNASDFAFESQQDSNRKSNVSDFAFETQQDSNSESNVSDFAFETQQDRNRKSNVSDHALESQQDSNCESNVSDFAFETQQDSHRKSNVSDFAFETKQDSHRKSNVSDFAFETKQDSHRKSNVSDFAFETQQDSYHKSNVSDFAFETRQDSHRKNAYLWKATGDHLANSEIEFSKKQSSEEYYGTESDSSKIESDSSFVWKKVDRDSFDKNPLQNQTRNYTPVYKGTTKNKYNTARAKVYKEFLGLDNEGQYYKPNYSSLQDLSNSTSESESQNSFKERRQFFEDKFKDILPAANIHYPRKRYNFSTIERNLLGSCNSLDTTVNKYETYLAKYHGRNGGTIANNAAIRTPTEYLRHLVQLRRDLVNEL